MAESKKTNQPKLTIIAGPNGSGKSTLSELLIKNHSIQCYLNADIIALGLGNSNKSDIVAGKALIEKIKSMIDSKQSLAFETTLSGKSWVNIINYAKENGYAIEIYFVYLDSLELAIQRVANRVNSGGHNIPKETIIRRYPRAINNFKEIYSKLADSWWLFNNSENYAKIIVSSKNNIISITDEKDYQKFNQL